MKIPGWNVINRNLGVPTAVANTVTGHDGVERATIVTLASEGTTTALIMLVIVILANGLLQSTVQPIAFGATFDLNPLAVLIVTIGFGCLFGMIGLILGAPLTSAALHISRELAGAKAAEASASGDSERGPPPDRFRPGSRSTGSPGTSPATRRCR